MSADPSSSLSRRGLLAAAVVGLAAGARVVRAEEAAAAPPPTSTPAPEPAPEPAPPVAPAYVADNLYLIVHPGVPADGPTRSRIKAIYLGNQTSWERGLSVVPFQRAPGSIVADRFLEKALGYDTMGYAQHWQGIELSGVAMAPRVLGATAEVLSAVASTPGGICYVMGGELSGAPAGVTVVPLPTGKN